MRTVWETVVNCRKVSNLLSAYMDCELPGVEQLMIRDHLKACESCCDEYESLLFTKRLLCGLRMKEPAESLESRIRRSVAAEGHRPNPESAAQSMWARLAAWWQVLAYAQKLRYSVVFALSSVVIAATVITPQALRSPRTDIRSASSVAGVVIPANRETYGTYGSYGPLVDRRAHSSILPTFHDPAENPPPANGAPVLIPVSADEFGSRGR